VKAQLRGGRLLVREAAHRGDNASRRLSIPTDDRPKEETWVSQRRANMRKCPYCAEDIQDEARTCKHCGRSLVGESESPDLPFPPSPPPPPATPPDVVEPFAAPTAGLHAGPSAPRRRRLLLLAAMPLILVAGVVGILLLRDSGDSMPTSIDGVPRLTTDQTRSSSDMLERAMEALGGKARMAAYGSGTTPSFLVVVYEEPTEVGFDEEFRAFSFSFMGTSGVNPDPTSVVDETYGAIQYRCQSDVEESISVCVMGGGRQFTGLAVMDSTGSDAAFALARKVHSATAGVTL